MSAPQDGPTMSALLDRFTSVDDLLEETNDQVSDLIESVDRLPNSIEAQNQALSQLAEAVGSDPELDIQREFPFPLSAEVPADTAFLDDFWTEFDAPYDGRVTRIVIESNEASQQGVGVRIGTAGGNVWVPRGGQTSTVGGGEVDDVDFLAVPTQPITIRPNVRVDEDNPIRCQFGNNDTENPHFVTVIVFLREVSA
ncbi:MAG: hypothetical protein ACOCUO_01515 [archaeon]